MMNSGRCQPVTSTAAGADLERLNYLYAIVWCTVALALLVFDRRFWTRRPTVDGHALNRPRSARNSSSTATPSRTGAAGTGDGT